MSDLKLCDFQKEYNEDYKDSEFSHINFNKYEDYKDDKGEYLETLIDTVNYAVRIDGSDIF